MRRRSWPGSHGRTEAGAGRGRRLPALAARRCGRTQDQRDAGRSPRRCSRGSRWRDTRGCSTSSHPTPSSWDSTRRCPRSSSSGNVSLVGARGFEPPTSASRTLRAAKLRHAPTEEARGARRARQADRECSPGRQNLYGQTQDIHPSGMEDARLVRRVARTKTGARPPPDRPSGTRGRRTASGAGRPPRAPSARSFAPSHRAARTRASNGRPRAPPILCIRWIRNIIKSSRAPLGPDG